MQLTRRFFLKPNTTPSSSTARSQPQIQPHQKLILNTKLRMQTTIISNFFQSIFWTMVFLCPGSTVFISCSWWCRRGPELLQCEYVDTSSLSLYVYLLLSARDSEGCSDASKLISIAENCLMLFCTHFDRKFRLFTLIAWRVVIVFLVHKSCMPTFYSVEMVGALASKFLIRN